MKDLWSTAGLAAGLAVGFAFGGAGWLVGVLLTVAGVCVDLARQSAEFARGRSAPPNPREIVDEVDPALLERLGQRRRSPGDSDADAR